MFWYCICELKVFSLMYLKWHFSYSTLRSSKVLSKIFLWAAVYLRERVVLSTFWEKELNALNMAFLPSFQCWSSTRNNTGRMPRKGYVRATDHFISKLQQIGHSHCKSFVLVQMGRWSRLKLRERKCTEVLKEYIHVIRWEIGIKELSHPVVLSLKYFYIHK